MYSYAFHITNTQYKASLMFPVIWNKLKAFSHRIFSIFLVLLSACTTSPEVGTQLNFPLQSVWSIETEETCKREPIMTPKLLLCLTIATGFSADTYQAYDKKDGHTEWKKPLNQDSQLSNFQMVITESRIFFLDTDQLLAINLASGQPEWRINRLWVARGIITDGTSIFISSKQGLTAFDLETGAFNWQHDIREGNIFRLTYDEHKNQILATTSDDGLYIFKPQNGQLVIHHKQVSCSIPVYHEGRIYCYSRAYDVSTGNPVISYDYISPYFVPTPPQNSQILLTPTLENTIQALDVETGNAKWEYIPTAPDFLGSLRIISNLAVLKGHGYVMLSDGTIRAFDIETGEEIGWWQGYAPPALWGERRTIFWLEADDEQLYAMFNNKQLYAFAPPNASQ